MRNRASYGPLATGLVLAAAALMAVVAVVALANRSPVRPPKVPARARHLVVQLQLLRRPQTGADRRLHLSGPIVPSLTRLAAIEPGNYGLGPVRIFVIVGRNGAPAILTVYGHGDGRSAAVGAASPTNP